MTANVAEEHWHGLNDDSRYLPGVLLEWVLGKVRRLL
jgi:hypothetical protein